MSKTINQDNLNATMRFLEKQGERTLEHLKNTNHQQAEQLEKLAALLSGEDFCKQFILCPDQQSAIRLFADNGLVLTEEDIDVLVAQTNALTRHLLDNDGALSEEELEQIAGGGILGGIVGGILGGAAGSGVAGLGLIMVASLANLLPGVGTIASIMIVGAVAGGTSFGMFLVED